MIDKILFVYFLGSTILSIPAMIVVDPGFSMSGYFYVAFMSFFCSAPMTYYFWPWRD